VASALIAIAVAPAIELGVTRDTGSELTASGSVTPPKKDLVLEVARASGKHHVVMRRTLDASSGSFSAKLRLPQGSYRVTARTPADPGNIAGISPAVAVHV